MIGHRVQSFARALLGHLRLLFAAVSAKNKVLLIVLVLVAIVAVFVAVMFLMPANEQNSGVGPLEPDAMHQPSTN
jgi:flagellar basal body-associated protein FliL